MVPTRLFRRHYRRTVPGLAGGLHLSERASPSTASLVSDGDESFAAGDFHRALECARAALSLEPRLLSALGLRSAALDALDEVEEARAAHEEALRVAPRDLDTIGDAAEFYLRRGIEHGDGPWLERARELAAAGAGLADRADADPDTFVDFILSESDALQEMGDTTGALARVDGAIQRLPQDLRLQLECGVLLFETCQFVEARRVLADLLRADPSNPQAHHTLGLIAEREGRLEEATVRFRQAHAAASEDFPIPVQLPPGEFDAAVEDALEELPSQIRDYLANVAITVENIPADDDLLSSDAALSPSILGIFRGSPLAEKASMDPWSHFPSSIVLYQRNLERFALSREELVEEIRVTLLHEVGHFLGLDEDQLRDRGLD